MKHRSQGKTLAHQINRKTRTLITLEILITIWVSPLHVDVSTFAAAAEKRAEALDEEALRWWKNMKILALMCNTKLMGIWRSNERSEIQSRRKRFVAVVLCRWSFWWLILRDLVAELQLRLSIFIYSCDMRHFWTEWSVASVHIQLELSSNWEFWIITLPRLHKSPANRFLRSYKKNTLADLLSAPRRVPFIKSSLFILICFNYFPCK